jgi:predicted ATPase
MPPGEEAVAETIIARQSELAALDDFLDGIPDGTRALLFEGEAGIGKTRLWREGVERARALGLRVLKDD